MSKNNSSEFAQAVAKQLVENFSNNYGMPSREPGTWAMMLNDKIKLASGNQRMANQAAGIGMLHNILGADDHLYERYYDAEGKTKLRQSQNKFSDGEMLIDVQKIATATAIHFKDPTVMRMVNHLKPKVLNQDLEVHIGGEPQKLSAMVEASLDSDWKRFLDDAMDEKWILGIVPVLRVKNNDGVDVPIVYRPPDRFITVTWIQGAAPHLRFQAYSLEYKSQNVFGVNRTNASSTTNKTLPTANTEPGTGSVDTGTGEAKKILVRDTRVFFVGKDAFSPHENGALRSTASSLIRHHKQYSRLRNDALQKSAQTARQTVILQHVPDKGGQTEEAGIDLGFGDARETQFAGSSAYEKNEQDTRLRTEAQQRDVQMKQKIQLEQFQDRKNTLGKYVNNGTLTAEQAEFMNKVPYSSTLDLFILPPGLQVGNSPTPVMDQTVETERILYEEAKGNAYGVPPDVVSGGTTSKASYSAQTESHQETVRMEANSLIGKMEQVCTETFNTIYGASIRRDIFREFFLSKINKIKKTPSSSTVSSASSKAKNPPNPEIFKDLAKENPLVLRRQYRIDQEDIAMSNKLGPETAAEVKNYEINKNIGISSATTVGSSSGTSKTKATPPPPKNPTDKAAAASASANVTNQTLKGKDRGYLHPTVATGNQTMEQVLKARANGDGTGSKLPPAKGTNTTPANGRKGGKFSSAHYTHLLNRIDSSTAAEELGITPNEYDALLRRMNIRVVINAVEGESMEESQQKFNTGVYDPETYTRTQVAGLTPSMRKAVMTKARKNFGRMVLSRNALIKENMQAQAPANMTAQKKPAASASGDKSKSSSSSSSSNTKSSSSDKKRSSSSDSGSDKKKTKTKSDSNNNNKSKDKK